MSDTSLNRRDFLKAAAASSAAMALGPAWAAPGDNAAKLARRKYKDDVAISIIGFPGLAVRQVPQEQANRAVAEAFEKGVNYYDVAPEYGNAQDILGPALQPYRKDCFLACKTAQRSAERAATDLKRSLELLKTDHIDLYQLHHIRYVDKDVDAAFAKGGAMETIIEAKKAGTIRYVGFTAHTTEAALAAMGRYEFDSVLFPVNFTSWHAGGFGQKILAAAKEHSVVRLSMKTLCRQDWPKDAAAEKKKYSRCWYQPVTDMHEQDLAVRWTLSQDVSAAMPPADLEFFQAAVRVGLKYTPVTEKENEELVALAKTLSPLFRLDRVVQCPSAVMKGMA
jgi:aryl-alcohol dehydrogenase-like predicted oxidoreductase